MCRCEGWGGVSVRREVCMCDGWRGEVCKCKCGGGRDD